MRRSFIAVLLCGLAGGAPSGPAVGADAADNTQARCHLTNFRPVADRSVTYGPRGNRCEGLYSSPVASNSLRLLGYHPGRSPAQPFRSIASAQVQGLPARAGALLLRAFTTRPLTNYAMDTTSLINGSFRWETSVLSAPGIAMKASEIAFVACSNLCMDKPDTVYYPVALTDPKTIATGNLHVVVQSQRELASLAYTLADQSGRVVDRASIVRTIPSRRPIDFPIPQIEPGIYTLRIVASATAGSLALLTVRIAQP